ncbi:hypothetical protein NSQ76_16165 [Bacillus sp. FSL M8-0256]|uniref:hypothetical protein n=1 Tax=Bacillus TaxID=1386 RepID=UPI0030F69078
MSLPKHIELLHTVKACKNQTMQIEDAATHLKVPDFVIPMLVKKNDDLSIQGNLILAKKESTGQAVFMILTFISIIIIAGFFGE